MQSFKQTNQSFRQDLLPHSVIESLSAFELSKRQTYYVDDGADRESFNSFSAGLGDIAGCVKNLVLFGPISTALLNLGYLSRTDNSVTFTELMKEFPAFSAKENIPPVIAAFLGKIVDTSLMPDEESYTLYMAGAECSSKHMKQQMLEELVETRRGMTSLTEKLMESILIRGGDAYAEIAKKYFSASAAIAAIPRGVATNKPESKINIAAALAIEHDFQAFLSDCYYEKKNDFLAERTIRFQDLFEDTAAYENSAL